MGEAGYKKLIVWNKANDFAKTVYFATRDFPRDERYGLTSQVRRAALSVPTNIVEGYARHGNRELKQFLNIAIGSLAEVEYLLDFSSDIGYVSLADKERLQGLRKEVGNLLWRFYNSI